MSELPEKETGRMSFKRTMLFPSVLVVLVIAALILLINPIINTPFATDRISAILSDTLGQRATVAGVRLVGGSIMINGIDIYNPSGYPPGKFLSVGYAVISPQWLTLAGNSKRFSSIKVNGLRISAMKRADGNLSFADLVNRFRGKKGGGELSVGHIRLDNGEITLNGKGIHDISVAVDDLSTTGRSSSRLVVTCQDEYGSPFRLEGSGRGGPKPEFTVKAIAPQISLMHLRGLNLPVATNKGSVSLVMDASLREGIVKLAGKTKVIALELNYKEKESTHGGGVDFIAYYDLNRDEAKLEDLSIQIDGIIHVWANGYVEHLKKEKRFSLTVRSEGFRLEQLMGVIPGAVRGDIRPVGEVLPLTIRVSGSKADGVTSATVDSQLRGIGISRGKLVLVQGVGADISLTGGKEGWEVKGTLAQEGAGTGAVVRMDKIPFAINFDRKLQPLKGGIPACGAQLSGIPVKGKLLFDARLSRPFSARLELARGSIVELSRRLQLQGVEINGGAITASVNAEGNLSGQLNCDAAATISGLQGSYKGRNVVLGSLAAKASGARASGGFAATGKVQASGGEFDGKKFSFNLPVSLKGPRLALTGVEGNFERVDFMAKELNLTLPQKESPAKEKPLSIAMDFRGVRIFREGNGVDGLSGEVHGKLENRGENRSINGEMTVRIPSLFIRDKKSGSCDAQLKLNGEKGFMAASGEILGGKLNATASVDLSGKGRDAEFSMALAGISASSLSQLAGNAVPLRLNGGVFSVSTRGYYGKAKGITLSATVTGGDLALAGKKGKSITSNGKLDLSCNWESGNLSINRGSAAVGEALKVNFLGSIKRAADADRTGEITIGMPVTPVVSILDSFANVLPPALQEAEATGTLSLNGKIGISGKRGSARGTIELGEVKLTIPSQRLVVDSVNGKVPFDLDLSSKVSRHPAKNGLTRENYQKQLAVLKAESMGENNLTIGKITFGTTEFNDTRLAIAAANGVTEIRSLAAGLFRGDIVGRGSLWVGEGINYGADIIVHDLSLRELCNSYPAIKGYISGRVDGFASLYGEGTGLNSLKGYLEFWSRSANDELMLISKEFLQKLSGKKLKGMFFQNDRPYDRGEISAYMDDGYLTFQKLDLSHTNFFGIRDLSVTVAPVQNKISLDHLLASIREAATRGKAASGGGTSEQPPPATEFKWEE
jgi:hypothetical protein